MRRDVASFRNPAKSVVVDDEATKGAVVGANLTTLDGEVIALADILTSSGTANDVRNILGTPVEQLFSPGGQLLIDLVAWENIQGIPANVTAVEDLTGTGIVRKGSPWTTGVAVSYAEIQNVSATDKILGRSSAGAGVIEEIPCTAFGRSLIDDAGFSAAQTTMGVIARRKSADEAVVSSTALQDDDHLFFPIAANEEWAGQIFIDAGAALATTGIKIAVTTPAGATQNIAAAITPDVIATTGQYYKRTTTSGAALDFTPANLVTAADGQVIINVWVLNGATAGDVRLQFAQSTSDATAVTFRKGSNLSATRIT